MTRMEIKLIRVLTKAYPKSATIGSIIHAMYADDIDGGPDFAEMVIRTMVFRLRQKLPLYGWTIPKCKSGRGNYGVYRLEPMMNVQ